MQRSDMIWLLLYKDQSLLEQMVRNRNGSRKTKRWEMGLSQGADSGDDENWPANIHSLKVRQMRFSNWLDMGQERKGRWGVTLGRWLWAIKRVALPSTEMETNGAILQGYWSEVPFWIYFLRYWWVLLVEILGRQKIEATGSEEFCCKGKRRNGVVNGRDGAVSRKLWFPLFVLRWEIL